jgi:hypothetical protein
MVKVKKDLTGEIFGRLKVLKQAEDYIQPNGKCRAMWLCQCNCEEEKFITVRGDSLISHRTQSCGCLDRELSAERCKDFKKHNKNDLSGDHGILWTTNTNQEVYFDLEDANKILSHTWYENGCGYPETCIDSKKITMHQFLGYALHDHIDRNKLNNIKSNFRQCTHSENNRNKGLTIKNTSGFIGVSWDKNRSKWLSHIKVDYKLIHLGRFENKEDAIRARLNAELKYFGEFAPQQHLYEQYKINIEDGDSQ